MYFFHPDHLGSSSYITDASGEVYQHLEYFAFGETFVEEHSNTDKMPYLYNGKELDEETGLYYYGARYYDAKTSVWLSVDPLAEKMPSWSPYNYTFNNPVRYIDPDGMAPDDYYSRTTGKYLGSDGASTTNMRLIDETQYSSISQQNGGTTSTAATESLQSSSKLITVDEAGLQSGLQNVRDNTQVSGVEHQMLITLNPETATVSGRSGEPGTNSSTTITSVPDGGVNFDPDGGINQVTGLSIIIGQAHGHPKTQEAGKVNVPGTSDIDKGTAAGMGIPIYSVDSYSGKPGSSANIHRVTPDGTRTNNVGKTIGNGTAKGAGKFNIGRDALEKWGDKN